MLKIGIDARQALKERRGIGTYVQKLIQHLAEIDSENKYFLYVDKDDLFDLFPKKSNFILRKIKLSNYILWEQFLLPVVASIDDINIMHLASMTGPLFLPHKIKLVATIHDVTYLKSYNFLPPSQVFYQKVGRIYRKLIIPILMKKFDKILTVSEFSKNDIIKHFPKINKEKIVVSYEAPNEDFKILDRDLAKQKIKNKYGIQKKYLLLLGGVDPRKNTEFVIKNYLSMREKKTTNLGLVIVGINNWRNSDFFSLVKNSEFSGDIIFTEHIPDEDLVALYNCAEVFLYPSLFEGFGLPLLEAMSCGVPIIASNTSCIPEVAGDAAFYIDPYNGQDFINAVIKIENDKSLRETLVEKGLARSHEFSWRKMAEETLSVYLEVGTLQK